MSLRAASCVKDSKFWRRQGPSATQHETTHAEENEEAGRRLGYDSGLQNGNTELTAQPKSQEPKAKECGYACMLTCMYVCSFIHMYCMYVCTYEIRRYVRTQACVNMYIQRKGEKDRGERERDVPPNMHTCMLVSNLLHHVEKTYSLC